MGRKQSRTCTQALTVGQISALSLNISKQGQSVRKRLHGKKVNSNVDNVSFSEGQQRKSCPAQCLTAPLHSKPSHDMVADTKESRIAMELLDWRGRPLHDIQHLECRPSLLSHHVTSQNLTGFYNLFVVLLFVTKARLVVENIMKYGVMIEIPRGPNDLMKNWPLLVCFISMHLFILGAWFIERHASTVFSLPRNKFMVLLQIWNFGMVLIVPYLTVSRFKSSPIAAVILLSFSVVWFFKLISFHHVCFDVRRVLFFKEDMETICNNDKEAGMAMAYPSSITLPDFYRFILMPTMCYQFHYPRTSGIRWLSVARHSVEALVLLSISKIITEQYIMITAKNTFTVAKIQSITLSSLLGHLIERVLKLSIPNLYVWLLLFMAVFHHWCNILAELTRFGDRGFYSDWWNASSFGEYWRKWNLPVHHFLNRHVNKPLLRKGVPRILAGCIIFTISALLHEYLVVVPLGLGWTGFVFFAFLLQIPCCLVTDIKYFDRHTTTGNIVFWVLFCVTGQPIGVLLYFYLWGVKFGHIPEIDATRIQIA